MAKKAAGKDLSLDQIAKLRASTDAISAWLRKDLEGHLETLRPLLLPRRHLETNIKGSRRAYESAQADRVFHTLQSAFEAAAGEPLKLRGTLRTPIDAILNKLELWPWEYSHEIDDGGSGKRITVHSPLSWVLSYASPLSLAQARRMVSGEGSRSETELRQFAIHTVLMKVIFDASPGLVKLLESLRYKVDEVKCPETGKLPFVRLTSSIPTYRPADSVILNVTQFSGVSRFEELVDLEAVEKLGDPLREKVAGLVQTG
jgi:hypothetical protein